MFGVDQATVSRAFSSGVMWLYRAYRSLREQLAAIKWSEDARKRFRYGPTLEEAPSQSLALEPELFMILDATEFAIQPPKDRPSRRAVHSRSKGHHIVNVLLCISRLGAISYVSPAFPGSITDSALTTISQALKGVPAIFQEDGKWVFDRAPSW
eukprot:m.109602 g.109602  ORF g.109602 m.109602 type:complete len:154 (+) comp9306_c0_seq1:1164-1625(+)